MLTNPGRFYNMYNPLYPIKNPQTEREKISAKIIDEILDAVRPLLDKETFIGTEGRCRYFMRPEAVGDGIRMNCTLTISSKDL